MTSPTQCWSCFQDCQSVIQCPLCRAIQPLQEIDIFSYLGLPVDFDVSESVLEEKFLKVQALVHPDRYGSASSLEQHHAHEHSAFANTAYQTLKDPIARAKCLLAFHAIPCDAEASQRLLMQAMEYREALERDLSLEDLQKMIEKMKKEVGAVLDVIKMKFMRHHFQEVPEHLNEMKYLSKAISEAEQLMEKKRSKCS